MIIIFTEKNSKIILEIEKVRLNKLFFQIRKRSSKKQIGSSKFKVYITSSMLLSCFLSIVFHLHLTRILLSCH